MGTLAVKLKYKQQINICIVSHSDNLLVQHPLLIRTFIERSAGRVCTILALEGLVCICS